MFHTLFRQKAALLRHQMGPLAAERRQYLEHCAAGGAPYGEQRKRAKCLLWVAKRLSPHDRRGVDAARLCRIVYGRPSPGPTMAQVFLEFGRPWLKFLGWWRTKREPVPFAEVLEQYLTWMHHERGLTPATICGRRWCAVSFLQWCGKTGRDLASQTMKRERLKALPLYPEERRCAHPTTEQVLRLFSHAERHLLSRAGCIVQSFEAEFTPLQGQVLDLLGVSASAFRG